MTGDKADRSSDYLVAERDDYAVASHHARNALTQLSYELGTEAADIFQDISAKAIQLLSELDQTRNVTPLRYRHSPFQFVGHTLSEAFNIVAELDCIAAVQRKEQTRRDAATQLNVHENTVARWLKDPTSLAVRQERLRQLALDLMSYTT